jgi:hypothetical protein
MTHYELFIAVKRLAEGQRDIDDAEQALLYGGNADTMRRKRENRDRAKAAFEELLKEPVIES